MSRAGRRPSGFDARRGALSDAGTRLAQAVLPVRVADPMSGFFLLPRTLVEEVAPRLTARGFKILLDILLSAGRPLRVAEVPYRFRPREHGASKLDARVLIDFAGLLVDKRTGGAVPLRFLSFAAGRRDRRARASGGACRADRPRARASAFHSSSRPSWR
jgi:dolichol-phosphate mannosyltransferase